MDSIGLYKHIDKYGIVLKYISYEGYIIYNEELYDIISIINLLPINVDKKKYYSKMVVTGEIRDLKANITFNYNKYVLNYIGKTYNIDINGHSNLYYLSDAINYIQ